VFGKRKPVVERGRVKLKVTAAGLPKKKGQRCEAVAREVRGERLAVEERGKANDPNSWTGKRGQVRKRQSVSRGGHSNMKVWIDAFMITKEG